MKSNIVLVGYSGVGKSTLAKHIKATYQYEVVEIGKVVVEEYNTMAAKEQYPLFFADTMFRKMGYTYFVEKALSKIQSIEKYIIVGPRSMEELNYVLSVFNNDVTVIGITAFKENRYVRHTKINNAALDLRDKIETSWGLNDLFSRSDIILNNNGTINELVQQFDYYYQQKEI